MLTERDLRRARKTLEKERKNLMDRARSTSSVLNPADERDTDDADIIVNIQTRAQELWARDGWERRLYEIERALKRLDQGEYGNCEVCSVEIDPDRLEALPETTMCVHCQEKIEKSAHAAEWMRRAGLFDFEADDGDGDEDEDDIDLDDLEELDDEDDDDQGIRPHLVLDDEDEDDEDL